MNEMQRLLLEYQEKLKAAWSATMCRAPVDWDGLNAALQKIDALTKRSTLTNV